MAPNSSVFNETSAETKPSTTTTSPPEPTLMTASATTSSDVRPGTSSPSTTSTKTSDGGKQVAPKMEQVVEENCRSTRETEETSVAMRFARVAPVGLDEINTSLSFRKSCLKRSSSSLSPCLGVIPVKVEKIEIATIEEKEAMPAVPVQKNKRRCWECKGKIGLTAVTCRCEYTFCNKHRYAEEHNCRFNFKTAAKRKLEEENPRIVPSKIARIN